MNANGRVTSIHTKSGMTINRGAHGGRMVSSEHVNARGEHIRTVNTGRGRGFVDHRYMRGGHPYMRRTYWDHGHAYAYGYRGYYYNGYPYYGYVSPYYYGAGFYGWAYNPWASPIAYGWGWGGAPWFGFYGGYFNPYPVYAGAAFWMTDYVISQNLQAAYEAQAAANANAGAAAAPGDYGGNGGGQDSGGNQNADNNGNGNGNGGNVTLTPEVKQAIVDEVKAELAAEQAAAAAPQASANAQPPAQGGGQSADEVPAALDPNHRTFIVSTVLDETGADGQDCSLTPGDVVTRIEDTPDGSHNVKVLVSSSQTSDCHSGSQVAVSVDDLQDMHNHFREQLDSGLKTLAANQGKNGLPAGPAAGGRSNPDGQAQPDLDAQSQLDSQQASADQAESDVKSASNGQGND